jgi:hypothetical protein
MAENKPKLPTPTNNKPKLPKPTNNMPKLPTPTTSGISINRAVTQYTSPIGPRATSSGQGVMGSSYVPGRTSTTSYGPRVAIQTGPAGPTIRRGRETGPTAGASVTGSTGETGNTGSAGNAIDPGLQYQMDRDEAARKSAFAILQDSFKQFGLDELASEIQNYMLEGISSEEATLRLRQSQPYKLRFKGNEGRIAKGLAAYSPAEYLQAEETYRNLLASSGLQDLGVKENFATLIGGAVSALEVQDRIQNVFNKIDNADPALKQQLNQYFRAYGVGDANTQRAQVAKAILTGDTSAQSLERSLKKAQLRTGAAQYAVNIAEANIESLQQQLEAQGVADVYAAGQKGFETLSQTQAEAEKLASIYKEPAPLNQELQQEAFFGLQSQRRKKLQEQERAAFGGQAGTTTASLSKGVAGSI